MSKKWKCPNKGNIKNHPEVILFVEDNNKSLPTKESLLIQMKAPRIEHCDICNRSYTKYECIEV